MTQRLRQNLAQISCMVNFNLPATNRNQELLTSFYGLILENSDDQLYWIEPKKFYRFIHMPICMLGGHFLTNCKQKMLYSNCSYDEQKDSKDFKFVKKYTSNCKYSITQ